MAAFQGGWDRFGEKEGLPCQEICDMIVQNHLLSRKGNNYEEQKTDWSFGVGSGAGAHFFNRLWTEEPRFRQRVGRAEQLLQ